MICIHRNSGQPIHYHGRITVFPPVLPEAHLNVVILPKGI